MKGSKSGSSERRKTVNRSFFAGALLLIGAVGFAAMCAGHALVLALGPSSTYRHTVQGPALEISAMLVAGVLVSTVKRLAAALRPQPRVTGDWALGAFAVIRDLGLTRVAAAVTLWQLGSLAVGEALEQRAAGVAIGGIAALIGSPLVVAPVIHVAIGLVAGTVLWLCACAAARHADALMALVRVALGWLSQSRRPIAQRVTPDRATPFVRRLLVAYRLGSRPPPATLRLA